MYQPDHFVEQRIERLHGLIRAHPLGLLITAGASGLVANAVPFLLDGEVGPKGRLRAHLARANGQWRDIGEGLEVLVVFQGVDHYITPGWYQEKRETGKVVPTWNYAMVQARGMARVIQDPAWLAGQIAALTARHEASRVEPWAVSDAPERYIETQLRGIVGLEIDIATLDGKWKVSQNRRVEDRAGVAAGLDGLGDEAAGAMAGLVRDLGGLPSGD